MATVAGRYQRGLVARWRRVVGGAQRASYVFLLLLAAMFVANLYLMLIWAPTERVMGDVQRIFYIHVPPLWVAFIAFFLTFGSSIAYLRTRDRSWDNRAFAAAEVGLAFMTVGIIAGAIWGKPVWGTWWTWDAKLTTTFVLWVTYVGYMMVRAYAPVHAQGARWSAVIGILGFINVPIVYMAAVWWRGLHPEQVTGAFASGGGLEPPMRTAFYFSVLTFVLLFAYLLHHRIGVRRTEDEIGSLHYSLHERRS